jgi:hypothetical protein
MALIERKVEDKIEVAGDFKHLSVRTTTIIERDGEEISRSFHRHVVAPDSDLSNESDEVKALAELLHTDEVKAAYTAFLSSQQ